MAEKRPDTEKDTEQTDQTQTPPDAASMPEPSGLKDEELSSADILAPDRTVQPQSTAIKPTVEMSQDEVTDRVGPPRLQGFSQSTTYVTMDRDIFASSFGRAIGGYTFDSSTVTADVNGDKVVYKGTLLSATAGKKAQPRTASQVAVMVLNHTINVRDGDVEVSVVKGGRLNATKLRDGATTGSGAMGVVINDTIRAQLAAVGIFLDNTDV